MSAGGSQLPRRLRRNQLGFAVGWACIVLLIVAAGEYVHLRLPSLARRSHQLPVQAEPRARVSVPRAIVARLRALPARGPAEAPLVLTYHGVEPAPRSPFSISPNRLQAELAALREAGYRSVGEARFLAWLDGRARLPRKAVLVTFDDGLASTWRYADPILRRLHLRAVAFLVTGHLDRGSYYLGADEVRRLAQSGRWSFGAHTAAGHTYVSTGPGREPEAFLVARRWLPSRGRRETYAEFARRVRADTRTALAWFSDHRLPRPELFAYPFSAAASPDRRATGISASILSHAFAARFLDDSRGAVTDRAQLERRVFRRLDVLGTDSLARFADEVTAATPLPLGSPGTWSRSSGRGRVVAGRPGVTLEPRRGSWLEAALAPTRTLAWSDYDVSADASGLGGGAVAGISIPGVSVSVGRAWYEVRAGSRVVAQGPLPARDGHRLLVRRGGKAARVAIDGTPVAGVPVGAGGGGPSLFVEAPPGSRVRFSRIRVR